MGFSFGFPQGFAYGFGSQNLGLGCFRISNSPIGENKQVLSGEEDDYPCYCSAATGKISCRKAVKTIGGQFSSEVNCERVVFAFFFFRSNCL